MAENVFAVTQTLPGSSPMIDDIDREAYLSAGIAQPPQTDHPVLRMMSSGKTLSNTSIRILNEHGHPLPDRVIGEILIHSDCMLTGYYNRSDITQKAFKEGWYRTGDLGYTLNGEVFISGRKKELIIVGGKNIYPQDIELLAYEVTGIHAGRAVVFGIFDEKTGTEEVAIVAEVSTEDVSERQSIGDKLRAHITKNSAIAIRYAHIVGPKWIIKTSSGKTARSANRDKFLQELQSE